MERYIQYNASAEFNTEEAMARKRPGVRGVPLSVRISEANRDELLKRAKLNDCSVTQVVDRLLDNSFRQPNYLLQALELAYGRGPAAILQIIARAMHDTGSHSIKLGRMDPREWPKDPNAVENVKRALNLILSGFQPEDYVPSDENLDPYGIGMPLGPLSARSILWTIKTALADSGGEMERWAIPIRDQLGEDLTNQIRLPSLPPPYDPSLAASLLDDLANISERHRSLGTERDDAGRLAPKEKP